MAVKDTDEAIDDLHWLLLLCENETVMKVMPLNMEVWRTWRLLAVWLWY